MTASSFRGRATPGPLAIWAGLITIYLVWGSTYLGIRVAIETIPPFLMAGVRFLLAGGLLYAVAIRRGDREADRPTRGQWRDATIAAAFLLVGGMGLVAWGERTVASGIAALVVALMPLWLAVAGRVLFGQRLPALVLVGVGLGFAGVVLLAWPTGADRIDPIGLVALVVSPLCWAIGSLYTAHRARQVHRPLVASAMQMLAGGVLLTIVGVASGELARVRLDTVSVDSILALGYLAIVGSLVGFTVYGWLLRSAPLSLIGTYAYVNPIVAVILGWLILGEPITARTVLAGAVIIAGVAVIVSARGRLARPAVRAATSESA